MRLSVPFELQFVEAGSTQARDRDSHDPSTANGDNHNSNSSVGDHQPEANDAHSGSPSGLKSNTTDQGSQHSPPQRSTPGRSRSPPLADLVADLGITAEVLSHYDPAYACHEALAARVRRDAQHEGVLLACHQQRKACWEERQDLTEERDLAQGRLRDCQQQQQQPGEAHLSQQCAEVQVLSQQLVKCKEDFWSQKIDLSKCRNERAGNSTMLKVPPFYFPQISDNSLHSLISEMPSTNVPTFNDQPAPSASHTGRFERSTSASTTMNPTIETSTYPPRMQIYPHHQWVTSPNVNAINFRRKGQLLAAVNFAHLVIDIDIQKLLDQGNSVCSILQQSVTHSNEDMNKFLDEVVKQLAAECEVMTTSIIDLYDLWFKGAESVRGRKGRREEEQSPEDTEFDHEIEKRQIFMIGAAILGVVAIGTYLFSHDSLAEISVSSYTNPVTIRTLADHEKRISVDERSIKILNSTVVKMLAVEEMSQNKIRKLDWAMKVEHSFVSIRRQFDKISQGIQHLHLGRFPSSLIDPAQLTILINNLDNSLDPLGLKLATSDIEAIFASPMSYIMFSNLTVRAMIHIPAYRPEDLLDLYEYVPVPFHLDDGHFLKLTPEAEFLAISSDTQTFQELTSRDLTLCRDLGRPPIVYCQHSNTLIRRGHPSCLYSMYDRDEDNIRKECPISVQEKRDSIVQLSSTDVLLYQHKEAKVTFTCALGEGPDEAETFQGFRLFHLKPGCKVETPNYLLTGSTEIYINSRFSVEERSIDLDRLGLEEVAYHIPTLKSLSMVGSSEHLTIKNVPALYANEHTWHLSLGIGVGLMCILIIVGTIFLVCKCGLCSRVKCCPPCNTNSEQQDPLETPVVRLEMEMSNASAPLEKRTNNEDSSPHFNNPASQYNQFYPGVPPS